MEGVACTMKWDTYNNMGVRGGRKKRTSQGGVAELQVG